MSKTKDNEMYKYNKSLVKNAQILRKEMTKEEKHLWYDFLKKLPIQVKRQKNIENYILDFYIPTHKTAIEIDGIQHTSEEGRIQDEKRDMVLSSYGIKVLRFKNSDINSNFLSVADEILNVLGIDYDELLKDR
jgi:very-short-patch-repair endonuclease